MSFGISLILILVGYTVILVGALYFCVFADPNDSPTAAYLTETLPKKVWNLVSRILGDRVLNVLSFFSDRFLLVVYCIVVFGAWSIIFNFTYPWIDSQTYVSQYHKYIGYVIFVSCVTSWRYATTTSPGIITQKSVHRYNHFPYDHLLFVPNQTCRTRGVERVARSKFDRNRYHENVPRFDHFCGWVYNTIGEENYRYFLLFLFVHAAMCLYGTVILGFLFYGEVLDKKLLDAVFFDRYTGEEFHGSYWIIGQYLFNTHLLESGVLVLLGVMAVALGLFFFWHVWITSKNVTTNESYKWDQVKKWYKRELKKYNVAKASGKLPPDQSMRTTPSVTDGDVTCTSGPTASKTDGSEAEQGDEVRHPGPKPRNIYDRGFIENWKEVLFPISLRKDRTLKFNATTKSKET